MIGYSVEFWNHSIGVFIMLGAGECLLEWLFAAGRDYRRARQITSPPTSKKRSSSYPEPPKAVMQLKRPNSALSPKRSTGTSNGRCGVGCDKAQLACREKRSHHRFRQQWRIHLLASGLAIKASSARSRL